MDRSFWQQRWALGELGFHRATVNDELVTWAERFLGGGTHRVLVPLCGKSRDLFWLRDRGHEVTGVELVEEAVRQLHEGLEPAVARQGPFTAWRTPGLTVLQGDVMGLEPTPQFDRIWDRAALVALPPHMRGEYAALELAVLASGGRILLEAFTYDQAVMDGPPHSVPEDEVRALYADAEVEVLGERDILDMVRWDGHDRFVQTAYLISAV